jgi:hypothetical protein
MDRDMLDLAYNNSQAVADSEEVLINSQACSRRLYGATRCLRNLRYGESERERYD